MARNLVFFSLMFFSSCTYAVNLAHTEGTASDVIEDTQTPSTTVTPQLNSTTK